MTLTRSFKDTVQARARKDKAFRRALLCESMNEFLSGNLETSKILLRDYVNATIGFEALSRTLGLPNKSLMRMLGPDGNPNARNLVAILQHLQQETGVQLGVK